jgi:hypothetical protein
VELLMGGTIPGFLLRRGGESIVVEAFLGAGSFGPTYAAAVTVRALVERKRRLVRNGEGDEVISETTVRARLGLVCPPQSRVALEDGTVSYVIASGPHDGHGLPVPSHLEVTLQ